MSLRFWVVIIGLFVLFFVISAGGMAVAGQDTKCTESKAVVKETVSREFLVQQLHLRSYEAAAGNISSCVQNYFCKDSARHIRSWLCAAQVCDGTDKSKKVLDCFMIEDKYPKEFLNQLGSLICPLIKSPSAGTRRAILDLHWVNGENPDLNDFFLVENLAYLAALEGSAKSCEDSIKNYVGAYGPQWNYRKYVALSGCRILAHERTREQEEKDFYTWFGVLQGSGNCSDIVNSEMRKACSTPGATSPVPVYDQ